MSEVVETPQLDKDVKEMKAKGYNKNSGKATITGDSYEQLFNQISDAVYYFKIYDNGTTSRFLEVNDVAYKRLGYTREELLNRSPNDIAVNNNEKLTQLLREISTTEIKTFETEHLCKDGRKIPVEIKIHIHQVNNERFSVAVCRDISDRKQSEREITEAKEKYEQLIESSINGVALLQDETFIFTNQTMVSLLDADSKEQLIGTTLEDMIHPDSLPDYHLHISKNNKKHSKFPCTWITFSGRALYTEIISIPLVYQNKATKQLIIQDVTEQKRSEAMMLQAEKMNIVGQLAAGIAHEIRNPLTSLKGFVQLFRSGTLPNEQFLDIMESELERIDVISSEFLTLAKPNKTAFSQINLQNLLQNVMALLDLEAFQNSVSIVLTNEIERYDIQGVESELKQVFINLIKNAIEAMPSGGKMILRMEDDGQFVKVSIKDEGMGMTDEQVCHLGEPFYTTKEKGTGLGLMVTYQIIHHHKGTINVHSVKGEGTTFIVRLPVDHD